MNSKLETTNQTAWTFKAYDFWCMNLGTPKEFARKVKENPNHLLRRYSKYLKFNRRMKILNPLGSNGKKAVSLSILGHDVTVVDISKENQKYALEVAKEVNVGLKYHVSDFLSYESDDLYDVCFFETGILHYFEDLDAFMEKTKSLIKKGGRLILSDYHPIRKVLNDIPYFEKGLHEVDLPYKEYFPHEEQNEFPKCLIKYHTLSDIINALIKYGFKMETFDEHPGFHDESVPGLFTIVAVL